VSANLQLHVQVYILTKDAKETLYGFQGQENGAKGPGRSPEPVIYAIGRLDANSQCAACRSNDFTALFSLSEAYIPDQTSYQCTPRTVAHITEQMQQTPSCLFCMLTYSCLTNLHLEDVPNSSAFTVTSHAWTAGVCVSDADKESVVERSPERKENAVTRNDAHDQRYVRIVFRVCEVANERDMFYFTHRDMGGGRT
jgi:hypothetical protein